MGKKHSPSIAGATRRERTAKLDQSIGFLIADTARVAKRSLYIRIGQHGVRGGHWLFLRALWLQEGVTQRELSSQLGMMEPSVLEMLRVMEREGLVRRERDPDDRRKVRVYLTEAARRLERRLMRTAESNNKLMTRQISRADEIKLRKLLLTIRQTLSDDIDALIAGQQSVKALALTGDRKHEAAAPKVGRKRAAGATKNATRVV